MNQFWSQTVRAKKRRLCWALFSTSFAFFGKKATAVFSTSVLKMAHPMQYAQAGWGPSSPYSAHIDSGNVPPGAMQHSMNWQDFHAEPVQSPGYMQYVPLPYHVLVPVGESRMMPFVQTQFSGYQGYPLHNSTGARQVSKLKLLPLWIASCTRDDTRSTSDTSSSLMVVLTYMHTLWLAGTPAAAGQLGSSFYLRSILALWQRHHCPPLLLLPLKVFLQLVSATYRGLKLLGFGSLRY